jgi:hypothetical protein
MIPERAIVRNAANNGEYNKFRMKASRMGFLGTTGPDLT